MKAIVIVEKELALDINKLFDIINECNDPLIWLKRMLKENADPLCHAKQYNDCK